MATARLLALVNTKARKQAKLDDGSSQTKNVRAPDDRVVGDEHAVPGPRDGVEERGLLYIYI